MKELNEIKLGTGMGYYPHTDFVMTDYYGNRLLCKKVQAEDYAYVYTSEIDESVYRQFDSEYRVSFDNYYNRYYSTKALNLNLPANSEQPKDLKTFWESIKAYRALLISPDYTTGKTSIQRIFKSFIGRRGMEVSKLLAILKFHKIRTDREVIISNRDVYSYNNGYYKLIGYIHGESSVENCAMVYEDYPYYD